MSHDVVFLVRAEQDLSKIRNGKAVKKEIESVLGRNPYNPNSTSVNNDRTKRSLVLSGYTVRYSVTSAGVVHVSTVISVS